MWARKFITGKGRGGVAWVDDCSQEGKHVWTLSPLHLFLSACWLHSLRSTSPCSWGHMAVGYSKLIILKLMVQREKATSTSALVWKIPRKDSDWSNLGHMATPGPLGVQYSDWITQPLQAWIHMPWGKGFKCNNHYLLFTSFFSLNF